MQFYDWFDSAIIATTFKDPVCGDGACDGPYEFRGVGRFGCQKDCGSYDKTTTLDVDLRAYTHSAPGGWDISSFPYEKDADFRYNIFSHTLQDFLWERDQDVTVNPTAKVEVPDGKLTLHLYQGTKLASNDKNAASDMRMNHQTFPKSNSTAARYAYGDPAEVVEFARVITRTLEDTCWETTDSITNAAVGCDKLDWWDTYVGALGGYGLAGTISISAGRAQPRAILADVPFCGMFQDGFGGVDLPANKQQLLDAAEACVAPIYGASVELSAGVAPSILSGREGVCISHYNCSDGLFCSRWYHKTGAGQTHSRPGGWAGLGAGVCQPCSLCRVDGEDAWSEGVGGSCPQDKCPGSGGLPACLSSQKLLSALTCTDKYDFEVWNHHEKGAPVVVRPSSTEQQEARFIVPHNRLVGAVVLTQERHRESGCVPTHSSDPQGISSSIGWQRFNPSLANYTKAAADSVKCHRSSALNGAPMGVDPVFMPSSALFDGHLQPTDFYNPDELSEASNALPMLFYPHSYDQTARAPKPENMVMPSQQDKFKVYFDERLTQAQARQLLTALKDGKFYQDGLTKKMSVELVTYNANAKMFVKFLLWFEWEHTGEAGWDFDMKSFAVDLYSDASSVFYDSVVRILLEVLCIGMLVVNIGAEVYELWQEALVFRLKSYVTNLFNYIDWISFAFQIGAWAVWYDYVLVAQRFKIETSYRILQNPGAQARFFATSPEEEHRFLVLQEDLSSLGQQVKLYSTLSGMAVALFIFRMLKSLDFQPRMGLVTRTIAAAAIDLLHFMLLFGIVFFGYAMVGVIVFGHQFKGMSTISEACFTLLMMMMSLDPTKFWTEMLHSGGEGMAAVFYLYLSTYILIVFFILLNVFLAILIDAYMAVKGQTASAKSIGAELYEVLKHSFKKLFVSKHKFMSDERLSKSLLLTAQDFFASDRTGSSLEAQARDVLGYRKAVLLHSGLELDSHDLVKLVGRGLKGAQTEFYDEEDEAMYYAMMARNDVVVDILGRYGENVQDRRKEMNQDAMHLLQLESLNRQLAVYRAQSSMLAQSKYIMKSVELIAKSTCSPNELQSLSEALQQADKVRLHADDVHPGELRKLTVEVAEAKNVPRMDLLGRCDTYCVLILNGSSKQSIYTTTVIPRNTNPEWNETFTWLISSKLDKVLTITLMDKDTLKSDDMVGCVYVNLHELPLDKEVNRWWPVENPSRQRSLQECKLRLSISVRSLAQKPGQDRGGMGVAAGRRNKGILPSRAPSSPKGKVPGGDEGALHAGWGVDGSGGARAAAGRPAQGAFFPGSSGIGWGIGGGVPGGGDNRVAPAPPTPQPASLPQDSDVGVAVDDLYQHLEDLTRGPVHEIRRPPQKPPHKMFKRAPSALAARGLGGGGPA